MAFIICQTVRSQLPSYLLDSSLQLYLINAATQSTVNYNGYPLTVVGKYDIVPNRFNNGNAYSIVNTPSDHILITQSAALGKASNGFTSPRFLYDSNFTVSAWISPDQYMGYSGTILSKGVILDAKGTTEAPFNIRITSYDSLQVTIYGYGSYNYSFICPSYVNQWVNISLVRNKDLLSLYINGKNPQTVTLVQDTTVTLHTTLKIRQKNEIQDNIYIGCDTSNGNSSFWVNQFYGYLDGIAIWCKALTVSDISLISSPYLLPISPTLQYQNSKFTVTSSTSSKISIEYSDNGKDFYLLDYMSKISTDSYDLLSIPNHIYYRAKLVSLTGDISYTKVLTFKQSHHKSYISNGTIYLNSNDKIKNIKTYDITGRVIAVFSNVNQSTIDISSHKGATVTVFYTENSYFTIKSIQ